MSFTSDTGSFTSRKCNLSSTNGGIKPFITAITSFIFFLQLIILNVGTYRRKWFYMLYNLKQLIMLKNPCLFYNNIIQCIT